MEATEAIGTIEATVDTSTVSYSHSLSISQKP